MSPRHCATTPSRPSSATRTRVKLLLPTALLSGAALLAAPRPLGAQAEYRNVDGGRPVRIEDALATPRHAVDVQLVSIRAERIAAGSYRWLWDPRLAYGILPRTELKLRAPFAFRERAATPRRGLVGVGLGLFHSLNSESTWLPALAVEAEAMASAGGAAATGSTDSGRAVATCLSGAACPHEVAVDRGGDRVFGGVAVDKALPPRSVLFLADVFVDRSGGPAGATDWTAEVGARRQLTPRSVVDAMIGRRWTPGRSFWVMSIGATTTVSARMLIPEAR